MIWLELAGLFYLKLALCNDVPLGEFEVWIFVHADDKVLTFYEFEFTFRKGTGFLSLFET